jgi:hypothetical protein
MGRLLHDVAMSLCADGLLPTPWADEPTSLRQGENVRDKWMAAPVKAPDSGMSQPPLKQLNISAERRQHKVLTVFSEAFRYGLQCTKVGFQSSENFALGQR